MNTTNTKKTVVIGLVRVPGISDIAGFAATPQIR
jgi:hypothetical protein